MKAFTVVKLEALPSPLTIHPLLWKVFGYVVGKLKLRHGLSVMINSTHTDRHMNGSLHYVGMAIDFTPYYYNSGIEVQFETLKDQINQWISDYLYTRYPDKEISLRDFDLLVYPDKNFFHLEFDKKEV